MPSFLFFLSIYKENVHKTKLTGLLQVLSGSIRLRVDLTGHISITRPIAGPSFIVYRPDQSLEPGVTWVAGQPAKPS